MGKLTELAQKFVKTSDDRRTNMIYVEGAEVDGGGLISLGRRRRPLSNRKGSPWTSRSRQSTRPIGSS